MWLRQLAVALLAISSSLVLTKADIETAWSVVSGEYSKIGDANLGAVPFKVLELEACPQTRRDLVQLGDTGTKEYYRKLARATYAELGLLRASQQMKLVAQSLALNTLINPSGGKGAAYPVEQALELGIVALTGSTSFFTMIKELLEFACEGEEVIEVDDSRFSVVKFVQDSLTDKAKRLFFRIVTFWRYRPKRNKKLSALFPKKGGIWYKKSGKGGAPIVVLRILLGVFQPVFGLASLMAKIPYAPMRKVGNAAKKLFKRPKKTVEELQEKLLAKCRLKNPDGSTTVRSKINTAIKVLEYLDTLRKLTSLVGSYVYFGAKLDGLNLDIHYNNLFGPGEALMKRCEGVTFTWDGSLLPKDRIDLYESHMNNVAGWLNEMGDDWSRAITFDESSSDFKKITLSSPQSPQPGQRRQSMVDYRRGVGHDNRTLSQAITFNDELDKKVQFVDALGVVSKALNDIESFFKQLLVNGNLEAFNAAAKAIMVTFANELATFASKLQEFKDRFDPMFGFFQIFENVKIDLPEFPFQVVADFVEDLLRAAINKVGEIIGEANLFDRLNFIEDFISNLLDELGLTFDLDLLDFTFFEEILGRFQVDLDGFFNPIDLLPQDLLDLLKSIPEFPYDLKQLFNITGFYDEIKGIFGDLAVTPSGVLDKYAGVPPRYQKMTDSVDYQRLQVANSAIVDFNCPTGAVPVVERAVFMAEICIESFAPYIRYPCPNGSNSCTLDVGPQLFTCSIPESDEFFNEHIGVPTSKLMISYFCLTDTTNVALDILEGTTEVNIANTAKPPVDPQEWEDPVGFGSIYSGTPDEALVKVTDTFQRQGKSITNVKRRLMDCSGGGRQIEFLSNLDTLYIDPCINGQIGYEYSTQPNRAGTTDLCPYKILFDEGLPPCFNSGFVGQQRLGILSTVTGDVAVGPCWSNTGVSWNQFATGLERCEVYESGGNICPFNDNDLIADVSYQVTLRESSRKKIFQNECGCEGLICGGECYVEFKRTAYARRAVNETGPGFCYADSTRSGYAVADLYEGGALFDRTASNPIVTMDCTKRDAVESNLKVYRPAFTTGYYNWQEYNSKPDKNTPYQEWQKAYNTLQQDCLGANGDIADCINSQDGKCDLQARGCLPPEWFYSCVPPPAADSTRKREFIFNDARLDQEPKTVSCPKFVGVDGTELSMELGLDSVVQTTIGVGVFGASSTDLTNDTIAYCGIGPSVSSCTFTVGSVKPNSYPGVGFVWEIYTSCYCPAGYARELVDGTCVPCEAGYARADGEGTCTTCPEGTYTAVNGSSSCLNCTAGTFWLQAGETFCENCPAGTFAADERSVECTPCVNGTYQNVTGQSSCIDTSPGYYQAESGASAQIKCPPGSSSDATGATGCNDCIPGSYAPDPGLTACLLCPPGTYSLQSGAFKCQPCPVGFYTDKNGTTECTACMAGLTTLGQGASSLDSCVPGIDPSSFARLVSPDDVILSGVKEPLPFNGLIGRSFTQVPVECSALLKEYLNTSETGTIDALREIENGYCNHGPWNTEACLFDGGDCCESTCKILEYNDTFVDPDEPDTSVDSSDRCFWKNFDCRDPVALSGTVTSTRCLSESRRLSATHSEQEAGPKELRRKFLLEWRNRQQQFRSLESVVPAKGNGVCDHDLNNPDHNFDDGDCCVATCTINPKFQESCTVSSIQGPPGKTCADGYGCCDPSVRDLAISVADTSPPVIKVTADFAEECGTSRIGELLSGVSPWNATVSDNDPCFVAPPISITSAVIDNAQGSSSCGGPIDRIEYTYTATDGGGNVGTALLTVIIQDSMPPVWDCPAESEIIVVETESSFQLPTLGTPMDQCDSNSLSVGYESTNPNLLVSGATVSGPWTAGDILDFTGYAQDNCGNRAECTVKAVVVSTPPPTAMPSAMPSTSHVPTGMPSIMPSASNVPSNVPSERPSTVPSNVPSEVPSGMPSIMPSKSIAPSANPSAMPSPDPLPTCSETWPCSNTESGNWAVVCKNDKEQTQCMRMENVLAQSDIYTCGPCELDQRMDPLIAKTCYNESPCLSGQRGSQAQRGSQERKASVCNLQSGKSQCMSVSRIARSPWIFSCGECPHNSKAHRSSIKHNLSDERGRRSKTDGFSSEKDIFSHDP